MKFSSKFYHSHHFINLNVPNLFIILKNACEYQTTEYLPNVMFQQETLKFSTTNKQYENAQELVTSVSCNVT